MVEIIKWGDGKNLRSIFRKLKMPTQQNEWDDIHWMINLRID